MSSGKVVHVLSGQDYDVYVGRAMPRHGLRRSVFANPHKVKEHGLNRALWLYEDQINWWLRCYRGEVDDSYACTSRIREFMRELEALRGKTLACWCPSKNRHLTIDDDTICHGQILLRLAEELAEEGLAR